MSFKSEVIDICLIFKCHKKDIFGWEVECSNLYKNFISPKINNNFNFDVCYKSS